jgi:hypothetical protein
MAESTIFKGGNMVTDEVKKYITDNQKPLWVEIMRARGTFARVGNDPTDSKRKALEAVFCEHSTMLAGASPSELGEIVFSISAANAQKSRWKQPKTLIAHKKDELITLRAEKKLLDKRIKELENMVFDGKYFRVRPPTAKSKTSNFRVQQVGSKATLIELPKDEANKHAKELDLIFDKFSKDCNDKKLPPFEVFQQIVGKDNGL